MHRSKVATNLTQPLDPDWELITQYTLGEKVHSDRKNGFLLSRQALKNAFYDFGHDLSIQDLKLSNYHELMGYPEYTLSLSHTKDVGVALVGPRQIFRSLGIDI
jgi:4'-phosphopantetheinyl transferase EntD